MRKKLLLLLIALIIATPVLAEEVDWSSYDKIDNAWDGQKIITNKQFEETLNALKEKQNKKKNKLQEKAIRKFKGNSLDTNLDVHKNNMSTQTPSSETDDCQLINIPVDIVLSNGQAIEKGYYKIIGEKTDSGVYIELYQAYKLIAKIRAQETSDDFNQEYIQFVKLLPYNNHQMKIIFGCVAFNAYALINFIEPEYTSFN